MIWEFRRVLSVEALFFSLDIANVGRGKRIFAGSIINLFSSRREFVSFYTKVFAPLFNRLGFGLKS